MKKKNMMTLFKCLVALFLISSIQITEANLFSERFIFKRQSIEQPGGIEKETVITNSNNAQQQQQPARLYPDLVVQPAPGPIDAGGFGANLAPNQGPTPFVPFNSFQRNAMNNIAPPGLVLNNRIQQQQLNNFGQQQNMSPVERQQSQTFMNGLGKRLLSMIGINMDSGENNENNSNNKENRMGGFEETMRALQNSTILNQLNKGVTSIYGSLSKMYNSTVQEQINLLQERFKRETENSTNPWQQRMAQQVPQFFQQMAMRVGEAQENLNRVWRQVTQNMNGTTPPMGVDNNNNRPRSFFEQFMDVGDGGVGNNNFFNQFSRPFSGQPDQSNGQQQPMDLGSQLRYFWHNQVQPQIGMIRGQMARVWRELTSSGALTMRSINDQFTINQRGKTNSTTNSDLVDEILKDVDLNSPEYTLIDSANSNNNNNDQASSSSQNLQSSPSTSATNNTGNMIMMNPNQQIIQNGLMNAQRELNQLWNGLTNSLQGAIGRVKTMMNPPQRQVFMVNPFGPHQAQADRRMGDQTPDPIENEIDGKLKDLTRLQKEADTVYEVIKQQQQQQQQQQQASIGDRFRNFFSQFDQFGNQVEQFPAKFSDSVSRFGSVVGDLWNQIPTRWNNFMNNNNNNNKPTIMSNSNSNSNSNERLTSSSGNAQQQQQQQNTGGSSAPTQKPNN